MKGCLLNVQLLGVPELANYSSFCLCAPVWKHAETWTETGNLLLPLVKGRIGGYYKERAPNTFLACKVSEQGDGLNRLTETHLIC